MQYEGDMKDGKPHGMGVKRWPNGNWYRGQFEVGKSHGKGEHFWNSDSNKVPGIAKGDMYIGDFCDNHIHGEGLRFTRDGKVFKEEWKESQRVSCVEVDMPEGGPPEAFVNATKQAEELEKLSEGVSPQERAKMQALVGSMGQANKLLVGHQGVTMSIQKGEMSDTATLVFKDCVDSHFAIDYLCTKVVVHNCKKCSFKFNARVVTAVVELYASDDLQCEMGVEVKTLQVDVCNNVSVVFNDASHMQDVVWSQCEGLQVTAHSQALGTLQTQTGLERAMREYRNINADNQHTVQFIVRILNGKMVQERLIRLPNGFPTTEREAREFARKQEGNVQEWAKKAGIVVPKARSEGPAVGRNELCVCGSGKKYKKCCGVGGN